MNLLGHPTNTNTLTQLFDQCWVKVADGGRTLVKHWVNVSCLLGGWAFLYHLNHTLLISPPFPEQSLPSPGNFLFTVWLDQIFARGISPVHSVPSLDVTSSYLHINLQEWATYNPLWIINNLTDGLAGPICRWKGCVKRPPYIHALAF